MRKFLTFTAAVLLMLCGCQGSRAQQKVMARFVPERADDFVFENNLVAGRIYGKALEGNPTSPGIDVWVKLPGKLVADEWYAQALTNPNYYHHDHGGKDCYKVGTSLGAGASAVLIEGRIQYPKTNYRSYELLEQSNDKVIFVLHYPEWQADGVRISLDKKITVTADSYFCKVEDCYKFSPERGETLPVAAGVYRHLRERTIQNELTQPDRYAIWERASDQSVEREDGMLGVAVYVPDADRTGLSAGDDHGLCVKNVRSGETFTYYFGSCWSKGDIKTAEDWFKLVKELK